VIGDRVDGHVDGAQQRLGQHALIVNPVAEAQDKKSGQRQFPAHPQVANQQHGQAVNDQQKEQRLRKKKLWRGNVAGKKVRSGTA
jgi:hypothetical protein